MTSKRGQIAIKHHLEAEERKKEKLAALQIQQAEERLIKSEALYGETTLYPKKKSKSDEDREEIRKKLKVKRYNRQIDKIDQEHGFE